MCIRDRLIISLVIAGMVIFLKRGQKKRESVWDENDIPGLIAPLEAPPIDAFGTTSEDDIGNSNTVEVLPLPEGGLPAGWTMEQWEHYGHQFLEMQQTGEGQDVK